MRRMTMMAGLVLVLSGGCGGSDEGGGTETDGGSSGMDGSGGGGTDGSTVRADGAEVDSPFTTDPSGRVLCSDGEPCACDNGIDDDGDGLVDGLDPECTGPYDDDEDTFSTGIPGDNIDFCQDCFFDGNSGMGDDGCEYHTDCLYGRTPPGPGAAGCFTCEVSEACVDYCRARTPNGCDCFGCCEVYAEDGSTVNVILADSCSLENLDDEEACPRCTQSPDCINDCGECELCPGRGEEDLPESCYGGEDAGMGGYTCEDGETVCSDTMPCPSGYYCQLGCCLVAPI